MAAQRLGVVLDPDRRRLRGSQSVDTEEIRESAVMNGDRLSDLKESDELEPVEPLGTRFIAMRLG
nr:hypothetical protein [Nocardioides albidus]